MVGIGVALVFTAGSAMIDSLESGANHERVQLYVDETDHRLQTAASTGQEQELPIDGIPESQVSIIDDGEIEVTWYGGDNNASAGGTLGALEFELEDRTIAHQGGGIWEDTGDEVLIESEPQIEYDGDSLQLTILQINESAEESTDDPVARADYDEASKLTERINDAARNSDGENVSVRITSSYHEGWYRYLEDEIGSHENATVSYNGPKTVVVNITNIREATDNPQLLIEEDLGLKETAGTSDQRVVFGDTLQFEARLNNTGSGTATSPTMTVSIDDGAVEESGGGAVPGYKTKDRKVEIERASYEDKLEPGNAYEYMITTKNGSKLDQPGAFYIGRSGTHFNVTDIETDHGTENATIRAVVRNIGVESGEKDVTISFDDFEANDTKTLNLEYGATGTVEWTVNRSSLPPGENGFTVEAGDDPSGPDSTADGTVEGKLSGDGNAFAVIQDRGVGSGQIVEDDGTTFTVTAEVANTYPHEIDRPLTVTIPEANVNHTESVTVAGDSRETVALEIDPANHDFEHGTVYEYDIVAEGEGLSEPGSFYFGKPGTAFELSNGTATVNDTVTISVDLHNVGVDDGQQEVGLELEYMDEMPDELEDEDPYGDLGSDTVVRSFGENGTVSFELNQSNLLDGEYTATIRTEDNEMTIPFNVTAGVDPGRVGLGDIEDAEVSVEVLGTQVSGDGWMGRWWDRTRVHNLAPMTLDIVTNGETEHSFDNPENGDNINIGPTWQDKTDDSYTYNFTIEDETELTLRNTRYRTCQAETTDPNALPHYNGPADRDFTWCTDAPQSIEFGPIDASQGQKLQNVRVRSAENNTIPALPAGTDQQLSATEVLERRGLVEEGDDELDLGPGEFVFLFENTESTDEDGINALWNDAIDAYDRNPDRTHDPNFNDLIVYVEVERAGVDPGRPSITIDPGAGNSTDVASGVGNDPGSTGPVDPSFDSGTVDEGDAPDLGTGESDANSGTNWTGDTGVNVDNDYIVVG
ncbi:DUF7289 family protein [Halosolutus gelatinilyticus]|uniref:DUF7289 family protein n=1 Tax=Halosolutus gelatinilyticus TaxID=2931975 RepID=UPI003CE50EAC